MTHWLLFVTNLPGRNQTLRMRVWRALKSAGAAALRDGVYVLPHSPISRQVFDEQTREIEAGGGIAQVISFDGNGGVQGNALTARFDRTKDYARLMDGVAELRRTMKKIEEPEARRRLATMKREGATVAEVDFFPTDARTHLEQVLNDADSELGAHFSPDEPRAMHRKIAARHRKDYQGRVWATREHLWIDRVCSAWLIRRFIDPNAKFRWLKQVADCPNRAVGFDFDGAEFSHADGKVTFEVMVASFALDDDAGLSRLGHLVHYLDVGGVPAQEAAGLAAIMTGARAVHSNDDALTKTMFPTLDCLYAAYGKDAELPIGGEDGTAQTEIPRSAAVGGRSGGTTVRGVGKNAPGGRGRRTARGRHRR